MATKIQPPALKSKAYEGYKQELLAWREVTELEKKKQGVAIALTLPEDHKTGIREKVFDQIKLDDLKKDDGLDTLITFMDKHLGKDDLTDSLEKFEDFEEYHRTGGQNIREYVETFDSKYRKIEKKNMKLPSEILAFKLLRRANITKDEKMLVLTGMNYEKKDTLYEEAKKSLLKFKGEVGSASDSGALGQSIKLEPAFFADNEEALLAAGYVKQRSGVQGGGYNRQSVRGGQSSYGRSYSGNQRGAPSQRGYRFSRNIKKRMNPTGADGQVLTCKSCGSYRHLVADCPDSWENLSKVNIAETEEDEHVVLFTGYQKENISQLAVDARNCAVLDSACSSTVCGETWLNSYIMSLPADEQAKVKTNESPRVFKFGGGTRLKSQGEYCLPAHVAGKDVTIKTDVVQSDIPLLLSRSAMKTAGVRLDLENDTATIFGKDVALNLTTSGHYCIPIDKTESIPVASVCAVKLDDMDAKKRYSTLLKLHRQFAHPPTNRLVALLKDANAWNNEFLPTLSDIRDKCDLCKMYAKTPAKPAVAFPMGQKFNEAVAMDLKQWKGRWILHMIDMWSRLTVSVFIERKRPRDVVDVMMKHWIGVFGVMGCVLTDNGGEFSSNEMREVMSILNVKVCTTAGESPFQNGLCERVHAVTDMMLMKLEAENPGVESQALLGWANMARNSLQMWNGYSSMQLVFGENPNLPGVMTDSLPALAGTTSSETFAKHLNLLHSARKAYIETEASERIRRALRSKIRASEQRYENGDHVYYKREGKERWLGPAKVVFQDGKVVFLRHGGVFVRVSPNRLAKTIPGGDDLDKEEKEDSDQTMTGLRSERETDNLSPVISELISDNVNEPTEVAEPSEVVSLKQTDRVEYQMPASDVWHRAVIKGRAGKASGKYKHWFNVMDEETSEEKSLDFSVLKWKKSTNDENPREESVKIVTDEKTLQAKESELEKLREFDTYEEVEDCGQKALSTRWVVTEKDGQVRARLVVRGFEEEYELQRDSPTVGKGAMKVFLGIASSKEWVVKTTDIKSAFLQGKTLDRDIYLKPPKESRTSENVIWKLKHCLYGLKDGARQFYLSVKEELLKLGFKQCDLDPAVFSVRKDGTLRGILCCHVDDFLHAGDEHFEKLMEKLRRRFSAGKIAQKCFDYVGFSVIQDESGITLDHSKFMEKIQVQLVDPCRATDKADALDSREQTLYRKLVGQLNWAVQGSRPDQAFQMIDLSTKLKQATVGDLVRATKIVNGLKDIKSTVFFPNLNKNPSEWEIIVFTDASLGNINGGVGSTGSHIVWIIDKTGSCCPIAWQTHKIKRVVRSTIAAEALSLTEGLETAFYYRKMIEDILRLQPGTIPIKAYTDNKSVLEAISSTKLVDDKRLRVDIAGIREMLLKSDINEVVWCPGKMQLADCMTKQGVSGFRLLKVLQEGKMPKENRQ